MYSIAQVTSCKRILHGESLAFSCDYLCTTYVLMLMIFQHAGYQIIYAFSSKASMAVLAVRLDIVDLRSVVFESF